MPGATVLVTGGTGGIGRAVVERLATSGTSVAFTYRSDEDGARALERALGESVRAYALDLRDGDAPNDVVERVENELGPISGLVNNAGVLGRGLLAMTPDAQWRDILDTNFGGAFRCCRAVLPGMVHRRGGSIVNVASLGALHGVAGQAAYTASKAAVLGMTRSLAREVGKRGIRANVVAPGFVATAMTADLAEADVARLRAPECIPAGVSAASVAATIEFLLSDGAASVTGQCIVVDAGASA